MERTMLIMIVIVAIVAIGGLLYIGSQKAPTIVPVVMEGPSMQADYVKDSDSASGQIKFSVKPMNEATGKFTFSMKG